MALLEAQRTQQSLATFYTSAYRHLPTANDQARPHNCSSEPVCRGVPQSQMKANLLPVFQLTWS